MYPLSYRDYWHRISQCLFPKYRHCFFFKKRSSQPVGKVLSLCFEPVVGKEGFQPPTPWFVATCSNPISYSQPCLHWIHFWELPFIMKKSTHFQWSFPILHVHLLKLLTAYAISGCKHFVIYIKLHRYMNISIVRWVH